MTEYISRYMTRYVLLIVVLAISGALLFRTSQSVQTSEAELSKIERQVQRERERLRVLQAEWAYLNTPYRLEMLASEYLQLETGTPDNLVPYEEVEFQTYGVPGDAPPVPKPVVFMPRPKDKPKPPAHAPRKIPMKAQPKSEVAADKNIDSLLNKLTTSQGGT